MIGSDSRLIHYTFTGRYGLVCHFVDSVLPTYIFLVILSSPGNLIMGQTFPVSITNRFHGHLPSAPKIFLSFLVGLSTDSTSSVKKRTSLLITIFLLLVLLLFSFI